VLGKFGKKVGEAAKKTEDLAGNMWQHCKPDFILKLFVPSRIMNNNIKDSWKMNFLILICCVRRFKSMTSLSP
jgi:hypothetical protein